MSNVGQREQDKDAQALETQEDKKHHTQYNEASDSGIDAGIRQAKNP